MKCIFLATIVIIILSALSACGSSDRTIHCTPPAYLMKDLTGGTAFAYCKEENRPSEEELNKYRSR